MEDLKTSLSSAVQDIASEIETYGPLIMPVGFRGRSQQCPVAKALKARLPIHHDKWPLPLVRVRVTLDEIVFCQGVNVLTCVLTWLDSYEIPQTVRNFIANFDEGRYPSLEE